MLSKIGDLDDICPTTTTVGVTMTAVEKSRLKTGKNHDSGFSTWTDDEVLGCTVEMTNIFDVASTAHHT